MRRLAPLLLLVLTGCGGCGTGTDGGYEPTDRFPPRPDPVVVRPPPSDPTGFHEQGKIDDYLMTLPTAGGVVYDPKTLPTAEQAELTKVLDDLFGTPAAPTVPGDGPAGPLTLPAANLAAGSRLYKRLCVQCHGFAGDGRGPTGLFVVNPIPRDFRQGAFKYVSSAAGRPTPADVARFIRHGAGSSVMPAFPLLTDAEVDDLTRYTVYLTYRGKVEYDLLAAMLGPDGLDDPLPVSATKRLEAEKARWAAATAVPVPPEPEATPEVIRRGHELFLGAAGCATCHADYGRKSALKFDVCGAAVKVTDLTGDQLRGGKESADLFYRVRCGIPASGMPASPLPDADVWAVTLFVKALPVPRQLPADVRKTVYPSSD